MAMPNPERVNHHRVDRRCAVQAGAIGLLGLGMNHLLGLRAIGAEAPKKENSQKALTNILMRILAVFAASGLSVLGAGAVVGIDTVQAVFLAGLLGVASVIERLARAFLDDGKLSLAEINDAFKSVDKKAN